MPIRIQRARFAAGDECRAREWGGGSDPAADRYGPPLILSLSALAPQARPARRPRRAPREEGIQVRLSAWVMNNNAAVQAITTAESQWIMAMGRSRPMASTPTP